MNCVAPKIPEEIAVLFENCDRHSLPGDQVAQHDSGGAAAHNAAVHNFFGGAALAFDSFSSSDHITFLSSSSARLVRITVAESARPTSTFALGLPPVLQSLRKLSSSVSAGLRGTSGKVTPFEAS